MVHKHWITDTPITTWKDSNYITNWEQFDKQIRYQGVPLLKRLDEFPDAVLVTGCQRSGTTMLARLITQNSGMVKYWFGPDDELDAALILSGYVDHQPNRRYCFQTTYVNAGFREYFEHKNGYRMIFLFRNPLSVIYSLLYNFSKSALERLFLQCGADLLSGINKLKYNILGPRSISRLYKACLLYNSKVSQLYELKKTFDLSRLMTVDYNDLVLKKSIYLPRMYDFMDLKMEYDDLEKINTKSVGKNNNLSSREKSTINRICIPVYEDLKIFCN